MQCPFRGDLWGIRLGGPKHQCPGPRALTVMTRLMMGIALSFTKCFPIHVLAGGERTGSPPHRGVKLDNLSTVGAGGPTSSKRPWGPCWATPVYSPSGLRSGPESGKCLGSAHPPGSPPRPARAPFPEGRAQTLVSWRRWGWALGAGGTEEPGRSGLTGRRSPFRVRFFFLLLLLCLRGST